MRKRVTANYSFYSEQSTCDDTIFFYCLASVDGTSWSKTTGEVWPEQSLT